jgi:hypothetical protein
MDGGTSASRDGVSTRNTLFCVRDASSVVKPPRHVLYCSRLSPGTQKFRATLKDMVNSVTPGTITGMLLSILRRLSVEPNNSPHPTTITDTLPPEVRNELRKAIREQAAIGWSLLLRGYIAKSWTNAYCNSPATQSNQALRKVDFHCHQLSIDIRLLDVETPLQDSPCGRTRTEIHQARQQDPRTIP